MKKQCLMLLAISSFVLAGCFDNSSNQADTNKSTDTEKSITVATETTTSTAVKELIRKEAVVTEVEAVEPKVSENKVALDNVTDNSAANTEKNVTLKAVSNANNADESAMVKADLVSSAKVNSNQTASQGQKKAVKNSKYKTARVHRAYNEQAANSHYSAEEIRVGEVKLNELGEYTVASTPTEVAFLKRQCRYPSMTVEELQLYRCQVLPVTIK